MIPRIGNLLLKNHEKILAAPSMYAAISANFLFLCIAILMQDPRDLRCSNELNQSICNQHAKIKLSFNSILNQYVIKNPPDHPSAQYLDMHFFSERILPDAHSWCRIVAGTELTCAIAITLPPPWRREKYINPAPPAILVSYEGQAGMVLRAVLAYKQGVEMEEIKQLGLPLSAVSDAYLEAIQWADNNIKSLTAKPA